ncbi:MAG: dTDP-4-dehydrorhamnose 3,5-epimerase [Lentisphaerae bacterium]|nr:dTDP-4-dehydrorhamnose 3,5-epimerase [Lentisphaerota bacterium]
MKFQPTDLKEVILIEPKVFSDPRGFFMEVFNRKVFEENGVSCDFVQMNHSKSVKNTLRGLHYQEGKPQAKLVRVINGAVFDVVVDVRRESPSYGKWISVELTSENKKMLFVPIGFAHGFYALSDEVEFEYQCSDYYYPQGERGIIWNDPDLNINWPVSEPLLSEKDKCNPRLKEII